jgi:hypothetical protein
LSKGRLEAEGAILRDIRRYSNRGKLGESAIFHRSKRLIFGRWWPIMSGLLTHRNNSIPWISLQEVKRVVWLDI